MLLSFWRKCRSASYSRQIGVIAALYLVFYAVLYLLILGIYPKASFVDVSAFLFLSAPDELHVDPLWGLLNKFGLLILTALSSSLLTTKLISDQSPLRFSKVLVYYSPETVGKIERSQLLGEYLVFRLVNQNDYVLHNVHITATLRHYDAGTRTYQHFDCKVANKIIPVLDKQMPFRIYVTMGKIVSAVYEKEFSFAEKGAHDVSLARIHRAVTSGERRMDADQMIIYVEGIDTSEGRLTGSSKVYFVSEVQPGKFLDIEPEAGKFSNAAIDERFDRFEQFDTQPSADIPVNTSLTTV